MPPKRLKEGLALDHTARLLRLASDPGFTEDLLGGPGWTLHVWIPQSDTYGAAAIRWAEGCDH